MTVSVVLEHLLTSLGAWLVGAIVGGALGLVIALRARALFTAAPPLHRLSMLIPGRTIVLSLLIIVWTPASILLVGLGPAADLFNTGFVIFLFTLSFTLSLLLGQWYPSSLAVRVLAGLRTLATVSLIVTIFVGNYSGIGWHMFRSLMNLDYDLLFQEWLILAGLLLFLDVLLGIVQLIVADRLGKGQHLHSVARQSQPAQ